MGDFTQPTPENVIGALAYAAGQSSGIQVLNFSGMGCNVYNPSTYSYLLARTDGAYGTAYGQTLGGFLNYVLTRGEAPATPGSGGPSRTTAYPRPATSPGTQRSPPSTGRTSSWPRT